MARKNLLASITTEKLTAVNRADEPAPSAKSVPTAALASRGAFGAVTRTIDDLAAKAEAARDIEARLTAGEVVVDLDPVAIDASFVADRLSQDDEEFQNLLEAIRTRGQDSPILVRPNPHERGRYQVAFGHRRLRAAKVLGRQVRAVVKTLSDRDLVLAQGQENSARANLSFIERALFARRLEDGGYDRETIMSALSVDKTMVSRMISVASQIPTDVIKEIGSAPSTGRDRWVDLAAAFQNAASARHIDQLAASRVFRDATSDERFNQALAHFQMAKTPWVPGESDDARSTRRTGARFWSTADGTRIARVTATERAFVLSIDSRIAPGFGDFLLAQMDRLYANYTDPKEEDCAEPKYQPNPDRS
jgi:ParB family transcriptional regulator, chromosome partitioning protein